MEKVTLPTGLSPNPPATDPSPVEQPQSELTDFEDFWVLQEDALLALLCDSCRWHMEGQKSSGNDVYYN